MRRMRTGPLLTAVLCLALAGPMAAQTGPTLTGETGLFQLISADSLPAGRFGFGLSYSQSDRTAAASLVLPPGADNPLRYSLGRFGLSLAYGFMSNWEGTLAVGSNLYKADARDWTGNINGHDRSGRIKHTETDKIRFGTKIVLNPKTDPVKVALFGGVSLATQSKNDADALSTNRADWDVGMSFTYGALTLQGSYVLVGDYGTPTSFGTNTVAGFDMPNQLMAGIGLNIPIIPEVFRGIFELNRIHYDGGDTRPPDFSEALLGGRFGFGPSGFTAGGAVRVNIDRWIKYGGKPNNIGGILQLAYSPQPSAEARLRVAPREAPGAAAAPPTPETAAVAPVSPAEPSDARPIPGATIAPPPISEPGAAPVAAPVVTPPPPRPTTSTTDEVLFDTAKSRLTNIAKAILDGVALRLKNNLSATCTISASTDPGEKGGDHAALAKSRAEAAKDYLLKRHGIDASRIKMDVKGDGDAGDATRNRRAVVTVTFP